MHIIGAMYDVNEINKPLVELWNESMKVEKEAADAPTSMVKVPEPFKKDNKGKQWKESITTYLHSKNGQASIPLTCIIREEDVPVPGTIYATFHDQLVHLAILHGSEFNVNNGVVLTFYSRWHLMAQHGHGSMLTKGLEMEEGHGNHSLLIMKETPCNPAQNRSAMRQSRR